MQKRKEDRERERRLCEILVYDIGVASGALSRRALR